jgi:two-component system, chemotaxis family, sensor kinase CheA
MESKTDTLRNRFFEDARDFLVQADALISGSPEGVDEEKVNELFRYVHSVKSEAAQLGYSAVSEGANSLEEQLEAVRDGDLKTDARLLADMRKQFESLNDIVRHLENQEKNSPNFAQPEFNMFEQQLLEEASRRGDGFYRIQCDLDPETPMKQARAYLLLSNLEQIASVIRTEPPIRSENDDLFATIVVYLTAEVTESEIYQALDVDQVVSSSVDLLSYRTFSPVSSPKNMADGIEPELQDLQSLYRLSGRKLNQFGAYIDEIKITLRELDLDFGKKVEFPPELRNRLSHLTQLTQGFFEEIRAIRTARMDEEFQHLKGLVENLKDQLHKDVNLEVTGKDVEIDRRVLMVLADPLTHLIRNAIDHGIESAENRRKSGKSQKGLVSVAVEEADDRIEVTVRDDGAGIDEDAVRIKAGAPGEIEQATDLLELISRPGFTTRTKASDLSGRGVGLDLVVQRIRSAGGAVVMKSERGKGTSFTLSLPKGPSYSRLLFFRYRSKLYAVPNQAVDSVSNITKGDLKRSGSGRIYYKSIPAYAGEHIAKIGEMKSYGSFALVLSYLGDNGCMLADDVLFEHDVPEELLIERGRDTRKQFTVNLGTGKQQFTYLSPQFIRTE